MDSSTFTRLQRVSSPNKNTDSTFANLNNEFQSSNIKLDQNNNLGSYIEKVINKKIKGNQPLKQLVDHTFAEMGGTYRRDDHRIFCLFVCELCGYDDLWQFQYNNGKDTTTWKDALDAFKSEFILPITELITKSVNIVPLTVTNDDDKRDTIISQLFYTF